MKWGTHFMSHKKEDKHPKAKPLKGFSGVMEIRSNYRTNTY